MDVDDPVPLDDPKVLLVGFDTRLLTTWMLTTQVLLTTLEYSLSVFDARLLTTAMLTTHVLLTTLKYSLSVFDTRLLTTWMLTTQTS